MGKCFFLVLLSLFQACAVPTSYQGPLRTSTFPEFTLFSFSFFYPLRCIFHIFQSTRNGLELYLGHRLMLGVLPLCSDAVGVFYSYSRLVCHWNVCLFIILFHLMGAYFFHGVVTFLCEQVRVFTPNTT